MSEPLFELRRDGVLKFTGTENECYYELQRLQGQSADYATKYGGWKIDPIKDQWIVSTSGTDCDGLSSDATYNFSTEKEAREFAESCNEASDGLIYSVTKLEIYE